jgi:hypothetical protein
LYSPAILVSHRHHAAGVAVPVTATAHVWEPLTLRGTTEDAARVTVDGREVAVDDRRFVVRRRPPLPRVIRISAVDEAGNRTERRVAVALIPRRPAVPARGVHVTFWAWSNPGLRSGITRLIHDRRINAVELDLRTSRVSSNSAPTCRSAAGSAPSSRSTTSATLSVSFTHAVSVSSGVSSAFATHPCGRELAGRTQGRGRSDARGNPYTDYGGFTNLASKSVQRYNIDIAVAAGRPGVDDILYDYVRRPDGPLGSMVFPAVVGPPENEIVSFLRESRLALRPDKSYLGASVFGVAATRPGEVAQPIRRMAENLDYLSPMVYPSHLGPGRVRRREPQTASRTKIVLRSLRDLTP